MMCFNSNICSNETSLCYNGICLTLISTLLMKDNAMKDVAPARDGLELMKHVIWGANVARLQGPLFLKAAMRQLQPSSDPTHTHSAPLVTLNHRIWGQVNGGPFFSAHSRKYLKKNEAEDSSAEESSAEESSAEESSAEESSEAESESDVALCLPPRFPWQLTNAESARCHAGGRPTGAPTPVTPPSPVAIPPSHTREVKRARLH